MDPLAAWMLPFLLLALILVAAKTHGREVRLLRELEGYDEVDFRRLTPNPPFVEQLWKRDRRQFWTSALACLLGLTALTTVWTVQRGGGPVGWPVVGAILVAFSASAAFDLQALRAASRFRRAHRAEPHGPHHRHHDAAWIRRAGRGTLAWISATNALLVVALAATAWSFLT